MPELKCTVQTCVHNKQYYCDLDHIQVGGEHAKRADETCCDSFEERTGDTYSNVTGQAPVIFDVRQQSAVTISRASAMPVRSVWRAETPVSVRRQNAQRSVVNA